MSNVKTKRERLIAKLTERFGADAVRVNTEYHVQVAANDDGYHDIWFTKHGEKKLKIRGSRAILLSVSTDEILKRLDGYTASKTDLVAMQTAKGIGSSLRKAVGILESQSVTEGVYVDAGYKHEDRKAKISAILVADGGESVDARIRHIRAENSNMAEQSAIDLGVDLRPSEAVPIFTDSQGRVAKNPGKNVVWIPRGRNKAADGLANMRGKKTK
jgi:hypothetical protein